MSKAVPTQKFGYIEIKQSSKVRSRKLKSWKRRWAVLTKMSNLSNEEYVAKLDLYDSESKWRNSSSDKMTFVLENVTCIKPAKSKTHQQAFEVIDGHHMLVMSGATELESYSWILSLQQIFTPELIEAKKGCYQVTVSTNEHSIKWNLSGDYNLTVSSTCLSLGDQEGACVITWGLSTLMKFNVKKSYVAGQIDTLVIECGPNAPTGHSCFQFLSNESQDILGAIRQSICLALAQKQNARQVESTRQRSKSATVSEKCFQNLLDSRSSPPDVLKEKSDSVSSNSTGNLESLTNVSMLSSSPTSSLLDGSFSTARRVIVETKENVLASDFHLAGQDLQTTQVMPCENVLFPSRKRSSSRPDKHVCGSNGYSEIEDVPAEIKPVSRRNTLSCEPRDFDIERLRSVSAVVAALKASNEHIFGRYIQDDHTSDLDSAISSMALSTTNDDIMKNDTLHIPGSDCIDDLCPCSIGQRRSSSTPDLQAFWKMHGSMIRYENVYEELDELRASVQRLNKKQDLDTPPELPARPFSIGFTYNANLNQKPSLDTQQSLLRWYVNPNYDDTKDKPVCVCVCEYIKGARSRFDSGGGQCTSCGGKILIDQIKSNAAKKLANEKLVKSSNADKNEISAVFPRVQNDRRRRSSDITPVASSFKLPKPTFKTTSARASNLESHWEVPDIFQFEPKTDSQEVLINLHEKTNDFGLGISVPRPIPKPVQSNPSDPFIHFFLDDDSDHSNPVVTEEITACLSSNFGYFTKSSSSFPNVPVLNTLASAQPNRTQTWHGQNPGNLIDHLDIWGMDTFSNNSSIHTPDASIPTILSNQFSQKPQM